MERRFVVKAKRSKNPVPKTARPRKRYLVLQLVSKNKLDSKSVWLSIQSVLLSLYGSVGLAQQKVLLKQFNPKTNCAVLQCNRSFEQETAAGLLFVQAVGTEKTVPQLILKTGILQKALEKAGF